MKMPLVDPESESEILRASTIMLIQLRNIKFGRWVKEAVGPLMVRDVTMTVTIEEILKGEVQQRAGVPFEHKIQQRGTGDFVVMDYYGLWSHVTLVDGVRFVAFCPGDSEDATVLLTEGNCEQLVSPDIALEDTKAALELEEEDQPIAGVLAKAASQSHQHGDIFARYVAAKAKRHAIPPLESVRKSSPLSSETALLSAESFPTESSDEALEAIITILEDPKTTAQARATYLSSIYEDLGMMASPPRHWVIRLIQAMFKLLSLPEAEPLHHAIREVYLPNLLGLNNPPLRYRAEEVFQNVDDERETIRSMRRQSQEESTLKLIQWLEGKDA